MRFKKALLSGLLSGQFSPARLFLNGEQGAWYDPSDWSTLSQDSTGILPVTAVGQPVGRMLDKSGRGNHATQPTAINRPVLQQDASGHLYLAFNGTNSWMSTGSIDFTATDKMMVVAGLRKLSDAVAGMVAEFSANSVANNGSFALLAPGGTSQPSVATYLRGDTATTVSSPLSFPSPLSYVQSSIMNIAGATGASELIHRVNGAWVSGGGVTAGAGNFGNYPLYLGARAGPTIFFQGSVYGLIIRGALDSDLKISSAERWMNSKTGAW